jgi:hypothetical protein
MRIGRRHLVQGIVASPLALATAALGNVRHFDPAPSVRHLALVTRRDYHDAALGRAIAERLLAALATGRLRAGSAADLADRLNTEIIAASHDAHFMVMAGAMPDMRPAPPTEPHGETLPLNAREREYLRRINFGFSVAEILEGNVGRIAIRDQFYRPVAEVRRHLALAMEFLADTDGLIVDLTGAIGGDPKTVALFISYFFDRAPFVVNRFRWRGLPVQEFLTTREPGGPLYGESRPVAVLVSASSFSGAEEFAYDMQVLKRGIIVGERTPGAANHALPVSIQGGLTAFVPRARAENPVTGTNWEGTGIAPDELASPPTVAEAHRVLLQRLGTSTSKG